jgi:hypothetical protein
MVGLYLVQKIAIIIHNPVVLSVKKWHLLFIFTY